MENFTKNFLIMSALGLGLTITVQAQGALKEQESGMPINEDVALDETMIVVEGLRYSIPKETFSPKTRQQVLSEMEQARKDGLMDYTEYEYPQNWINYSKRDLPEINRKKVVEDMVEARKRGLLNPFSDIYTEFVEEVDDDSVKGKTRQQVIDELIIARNAGLLEITEENYPPSISDQVFMRMYNSK